MQLCIRALIISLNWSLLPCHEIRTVTWIGVWETGTEIVLSAQGHTASVIYIQNPNLPILKSCVLKKTTLATEQVREEKLS